MKLVSHSPCAVSTMNVSWNVSCLILRKAASLSASGNAELPIPTIEASVGYGARTGTRTGTIVTLVNIAHRGPAETRMLFLTVP